MISEPNSQSDVSKDSFGKQLGSFGYVYWVANWIELVERFRDVIRTDDDATGFIRCIEDVLDEDERYAT